MVLLGIEEKCKNKRMINLIVMLMKSAIWERRVEAKKQGNVMMYGMFLKGSLRYVEYLHCYVKQENKMHDFYKVFTSDVYNICNEFNLGMPERE